VYLQVWKKGETYSGTKGSPLAWLVTIARSRAIDALRSRAVREFEQQVPLETAGGVADAAPDPEEHSSLAQRGLLVQRALAALPKDQREAIELAFFRGLSHVEVAEALGQPLGTIKTRVRLGMTRLRESLLCYEEGL
jgi:RNA polymerase sigma-70 factor (ECF subfamily)